MASEIQFTSNSTENMETLKCLQLGIAYALDTTKGKKDILMTDFNAIETVVFPKSGSARTPAHEFNTFTFKTFANETFHHLRQQFSIDTADFKQSLCHMQLKCLHNPGASGSLLFTSADDNYILKTVSDKEARFLQQLLPGYWMNIHQNDKTLLPKFFGLYAYQSIRFVVMNNVLPSNIKYEFKFDLKGSTYNRTATDTIGATQGNETATLKDNDFHAKLSQGVIMTADKRDILVESLERDCAVLESFESMDYSLLVGVHNVTKVVKEKTQNAIKENSQLKGPKSILKSVLRTKMSIDTHQSNYESPLIERHSIQLATHLSGVPDGGFPAKLPNGDFVIIFVGVIDILQNFRAKKKIEHAVKSIVIEKETFSVQKPPFYAKRFLKFMKDEVFREPEKRKKKGVTFGGVRRSSLVESATVDEIPDDYPVRPGSAEGERKMGMLKRQATVETDPLLDQGDKDEFSYEKERVEEIHRVRKSIKMYRQSAVEETHGNK